MPIRCQTSIFALAVVAVPLVAVAQETSSLPLWEIGAVGLVVHQRAYAGASEHVNRGLALPYLIYRGQVFRADRDGAGFRARLTRDVELDVGVAAAFGARSSAIGARRGMPDIGTLVELGPRLKWHLGAGPGQGRLRAEFPVRGVFDLDDSLAHRGMAFEPKLILERSNDGSWSYSTSIGPVWGDRRLADTFYGVAPSEAISGRPAYVAQGGLIAWRLSASFSRQLSRDLRLFGFARADTLRGAANASSPLVLRQTGGSVGMGITYTLMRSESRVAD